MKRSNFRVDTGWESVSEMAAPTRQIHIIDGSEPRRERVQEMNPNQRRTAPRTASQRASDQQFVSEYTNLKDAASVVLSAAVAMGLVDSDKHGSVGGYTTLSADEKAALSFEGVAELGKLHKGDPGKQAKIIRAALKMTGATVSEMTKQRLDHMTKQAEWAKQRQAVIDEFAKRPDVVESERRLAEYGRNRFGIAI